MAQAFPAPPTFTPIRSHDGVDGVTVEVAADYHDDIAWSGVFIYTVEDDLITSERAYFSGPFEAADWRAPFREALA